MFDTHILTSSQTCIVDTKAIVSHPHFVQFVQDGQVIGEVSATFDFSQLPGAYHVLALQFLAGHRCILPSSTWLPVREEKDDSSSNRWWKFW